MSNYLNRQSNKIRAINIKNGWDVPTEDDFYHNIDKVFAKLLLVNSEISEAVEELRKPNFDIENVKEELADTYIRLSELWGAIDIDMEKTVLNKLEKNKGRGYKHGKRV